MEQKEFSTFGGDRNYRIKREKLHETLKETSQMNSFEKHLIQEGIKQVLYGEGTEEIRTRIYEDKQVIDELYQRKVTDEMIDFLLQYDVIEKI